MMPLVHKNLMRGGCPTKKGSNFSSTPMFQEKRDVKASKQGEVSSQASNVPIFISSKSKYLMKRWRRTSKMDGPLKMCSRNAQKVPPRYYQALKSRKYDLQGKEGVSPSQIVTKNTHMVVVNPTLVDRPSNHARKISKSDKKKEGDVEYLLCHVYRMSMYAIIAQMCLRGCH